MAAPLPTPGDHLAPDGMKRVVHQRRGPQTHRRPLLPTIRFRGRLTCVLEVIWFRSGLATYGLQLVHRPADHRLACARLIADTCSVPIGRVAMG